MDLFDSPALITATDITGQLPTGFRPTDEVDVKLQAVTATIRRYLAEGWALFQAWSGGKDSSVQLALTLQALRAHIAEHGRAGCPELVVMHSDTLIENPVIQQHTQSDLMRIQAYAQQHDLPVTVELAEPALSENYLVNLIGHRCIASVAGSARTCSVMLKVKPLQRLKAAILKRLKGSYGSRVLTLVGKRYDESDYRRRDMIAAGEVPHEHISRSGENLLCSIAHLTLDDVYWVIGLVRSGLLASYSDFDSLVETYRAANGGECMINAMDGQAGTGCGARYGCWLCLQTGDDHSMENLLAEPEQAWLRPLWLLRNYIQHQHHNPAARCWLSRKLNDDGTLNVAPNSYSPALTEQLLAMVLSIQVAEVKAAEQAGVPSRFRLMTFAEVIAIECQWCRYGYHRPLQALRIWRDVVLGARLTLPPTEQPAGNRQRLNDRLAGVVPFADQHYSQPDTGFRNPLHQVADQEQLIHKATGTYAAVNTAAGFQINTDELAMYVDYELAPALRRYNRDDLAPSAGLHHLLSMGLVSLHQSAHRVYDEMVRLGNQIHRLGLRPILHQPDALLQCLGGIDKRNSQQGMLALDEIGGWQ